VALVELLNEFLHEGLIVGDMTDVLLEFAAGYLLLRPNELRL